MQSKTGGGGGGTCCHAAQHQHVAYTAVQPRSSADAEIARHANRLMAPKCTTPHVSIPCIMGCHDLGEFWHAGSQGTDLSCHVPISIFCCTIYQRYRRTDRRHARSISATCYAHVALKYTKNLKLMTLSCRPTWWEDNATLQFWALPSVCLSVPISCADVPLSLNSTGPTRTRTSTPTQTSSLTYARESSRGSRPAAARAARSARRQSPRTFVRHARFPSRGCPLGMRACTRVRVL